MTATSTRAWLYVRGAESVRIVIDGTAVAVYGPGGRVNHSRLGDEMDATLHQAAVEQSLVHDGWTLEQLTTERRVTIQPPRVERRASSLRLIPK